MFKFKALDGREWTHFETREAAESFKARTGLKGYTAPIPTPAECERCKWDTMVPHDNCLYHGKAIGHCEAHCTADACF